ncbi:RES family NAD+ phosphorylase [Pectobacterium brasiliense]|uniref:RES family NAD+ phosphorylase n=1 Tax=Pectobacterium brasiliense TaxID=180957 RepID=UPI001CF50810|nr:RES family NAD+ phosphorylase [Pectobacterium brasiliense]MCA6984005.1 RES domain-containing protein [Pectobacterium brasiliense]
MIKWTFDKTVVAQGIAAQNNSGRIPAINIQQGPDLLKRHQRKLYKSAINFSAPIEKDDCGRYNPLGGSVAVWYASDSALTAAAEAYGRLFHLKGTISYPESVLSQHYMCSVDVVRTVKVIDVVALCELLHIPLDSLENEDYTFPQWLMEHLYTHFGRDYDGIAYTQDISAISVVMPFGNDRVVHQPLPIPLRGCGLMPVTSKLTKACSLRGGTKERCQVKRCSKNCLDSKLRQNQCKSKRGWLAPLFKSVNWLLDFRTV